MNLDVLDTERIWCNGTVKKIIRNQNHANTLLIHYTGWNDIYDEYLCVNSSRIAPYQYFTSREGIPKYANHGRNDMMVSYIIYNNEGRVNYNQYVADNHFQRIINDFRTLTQNVLNEFNGQRI